MKLSIITISYNAENCIEKTIISVLNQSKPIYEYVFVDGGSNDNTNNIIESYRDRFQKKNVKIVHISEKDKGISDAFNKGIELATGDLIGIINADDELCENTSELLQVHVNNNPGCDVVYGNCIWLDELNNFSYIKKPRHNLERLYYDLVLIHPATFVTKEAYKKFGCFNINYKLCMDKELLCRMYVEGAKFSYLDKELALMRAGGVSDTNAIKTIKEGIKLSNYYNKPKLYTYLLALKKIIKHKLSTVAKKTPLYSLFKNNL